MNLTSLLGLAGGLGLFIYGMQMCSEGLQKMAAHRLKKIISILTKNPILSFFSGAVITFGLQGSGASSTLVVGLISAGMITLAQALDILVGTMLGGSLTLQLIAFPITDIASLLVIIGIVLYLGAKRSKQRNLGQTILGFGLLFFGMHVMITTMAPLRNNSLVIQTLTNLERNPFLEFLIALVISAMIQSSTSFLALLMTLASHGLIGQFAIIPFVLGGRLGGTATGLISSLGAPGRDSKRAAIANFGFKLISALVFLPFYKPLTGIVLLGSPDFKRAFANADTFFSIIMAVVLLPLTIPIAGLIKKLIPDKRPEIGEAVFLDESLLEIPELAIIQAHRQTVEMGRIVSEEMLSFTMPLIHYGNEAVIDRLDSTEQAVDSLYKSISSYVTSIGNNSISDEFMQKTIQILYVANDLEHVGDIMTIISKNALKLHAENIDLSQEGFEELEDIYQQVFTHFKDSVKAFELSDQVLATRIIKEHPKILRLEKELRYSHFDRMQHGNPKTIATSAIHLDLVEAMLRIDSHSVNIAQVVMGII
jgi:phosphate:Na+ symporter